MGSITKRSWFTTTGFAVVLMAMLTSCFSDSKLTLVADSAVPVYAGVDEALAPPEEKNVIAELQPQQEVEVVRCVDVKHYLIYKVQLPDGRIGFVNDGKYTLLRDGNPSYCN